MTAEYLQQNWNQKQQFWHWVAHPKADYYINIYLLYV